MSLNLRPYPISKDPRELRDWFFRIFEMLTREDSIPWVVVDKDGDFEEEIQDVVGAMVTGNVETGVDVTYDDTAGKLNFKNEYLVNWDVDEDETIPAEQFRLATKVNVTSSLTVKGKLISIT